jgi:CheY-like chemotaxis protein
VDSAYHSWKEADARARELAAQLALAWHVYDVKNVGVPAADLMSQVGPGVSKDCGRDERTELDLLLLDVAMPGRAGLNEGHRTVADIRYSRRLASVLLASPPWLAACRLQLSPKSHSCRAIPHSIPCGQRD